MDILHDNSFRSWLKLAELIEPGIPDYVREYTPIEGKTASDLSDALYADPLNRLFPIDSPSDTWLSAAYFALNKEALSYKPAMVEQVEQRIVEAATVYDIADDVKQAMAIVADSKLEKSAADSDDNYGWIEKAADGTVLKRRYPMFDSIGVEKAAAYFMTNRNQYPFAMRKTIAQAITKKAGDYGVTVPGDIMREAGCGIPRRTVLMREVIERAHMAKDAEAGALLLNINTLIGEMDPAEVGKNLDKMAEVIDEFDRLEGLNKAYGRKVTHPADFLYGISIKEAEACLDNAITLDQLTFDITKLASLDASVWEDALGEDWAKDVAFEDVKLLKQALADLSAADRSALETHIVLMCQ